MAFDPLEFVRQKLAAAYDAITGKQRYGWSRVVMWQECEAWLQALGPEKLSVLEISGTFWSKLPFAKYRSVQHPEFDICEMRLDESFDLIIAEQVFEHLLWPYRAGRNVHQMLRPGGHFLVSTPFLVRIHPGPADCTRWTETGLKYFLAECGFPLEAIKTGSWGNRACVRANLNDWALYRPRLHSLKNEPDVPYHVWALARK
jgi:SAM-dependent methyltransferase